MLVSGEHWGFEWCKLLQTALLKRDVPRSPFWANGQPWCRRLAFSSSPTSLLLPGRAALTVRTTRLVSSEVEMYLMTQGGV
jgi:hypothetical protein